MQDELILELMRRKPRAYLTPAGLVSPILVDQKVKFVEAHGSCWMKILTEGGDVLQMVNLQNVTAILYEEMSQRRVVAPGMPS